MPCVQRQQGIITQRKAYCKWATPRGNMLAARLGGERAGAEDEGVLEPARLEHKQWVHCRHRPDGESPPGLMEPPKQAPLARVGLGI